MWELAGKLAGIVEILFKWMLRPAAEKEAENKLSAKQRWDKAKKEIEQRKLLRWRSRS